MKQNLVALAVAGALAAPGLALAQATTSGTNVQVYGLFDVKGDYMKLSNGTAGTGQVSKTHLATGAPNRLGFRGTESLGGGLTAFFQVETQIFTDARQDGANAAHTNATLGGRPTFAGLRGAWGDLSLGYQESVYKDVYQTTWSVNPDNAMFGAIMGNGNTSGALPSPNCNGLTASGTGALTAGTAVGGANCAEGEGSTTAFNRTMSDSVTYRSPVMAGFRFGAMLTANEFKAPTSATVAGTNQVDPRFGAYSLTWAAGPLSLAGAYEQHTGFRATNTAAAPNNQAKDKGMTFGARFNYGAGLIGAGYEQLKYESTTAAGNGFTLKNWIVQGTFNLTPSDVLFGGYSKTNGLESCGAGIAATCGSQSGAKFMTLGVDHSFSKRTAVYAYWSKIDNNATATYNYLSDSRPTSNGNGSGSGLIAGQDSTSYNVGVKHSF